MLPMIPPLSSVVLALSALGGPTDPGLPSGVFLEARNAAVFAGACHYNAELVNSGEHALAAWSFERGSWEGVDLGGTRALLALGADRNLVLEGAARRSVLYLDAGSDAQRAALTALFRARYASLLGELVALRRAAIEFQVGEEGYRLAIEGIAELEGRPLPDRACCSMPSSVWYRPLLEEDRATRTAGVLVGCTETLRYRDAAGAAPVTSAPGWSRFGENDAFLGRFRLAAGPVLGPAAEQR